MTAPYGGAVAVAISWETGIWSGVKSTRMTRSRGYTRMATRGRRKGEASTTGAARLENLWRSHGIAAAAL